MLPSAAFLESKKKAVQQYEMAFHLVHATYAFVRDPKLLIGVLHNLTQAFDYAIDALLVYERQLRRIPPYPNTPAAKLEVFRSHCLRQHQIPSHYLALFLEMKELLALNKEAPISFQKGSRYVLCNKDYEVKIISAASIRAYLEQTKAFLDDLERVLPAENAS